MSKTKNKNGYFFTWETTEGEMMESPIFTNRTEANLEKDMVVSLFKGKITSKNLIK